MSPRPPLRGLPVLCLALAACSVGAGPSPSPADTAATAAPATPALTPVLPPASATTSTPSSGAPGSGTAPTEPEAALLHGARMDLQGKCAPLRTSLPAGATGAIECTTASDLAARVSMFMFDTQGQLLDAYNAVVASEAIEPRSNGGRCEPAGASEGGYVPGDGHPGVVVVERGACWADAAGITHYVATVPPFVLVQVDGREGTLIGGTERFAWLGNQDAPGGPTLWAEEPRSPEK